ncbi:MAG TPA: hypothetical protein DCR97_11960 [Deltaproteobacteria bacterium]|nr:hypothetical protein [Deltaproteobacteria bacterium]
MENYLGLILLVMLALALLNFLRRGRFLPPKEYAVSDEAAGEMEGVLGQYRELAAARGGRIDDIALLPAPKEMIKLYLQVSIGLAALNARPRDQFLEDYYQLAYFQQIDEGDERFFPLTVREEHDGGDRRTAVARADGGSDGEVGAVERKYLDRAAHESSALEKELQAFLKRKRLF